MAGISREDIESVRASADIVDIISRYLPLERKGKEYLGVCPFHADTNPSMHVSPDKQIYKCFSCGAGGNVFRFVSKMENLSFPASVIRVSEMIGQPIQASVVEESEETKRLKPLWQTLKNYLDFCSYELYSEDGKPALDYLRERKFSDELISRFQIGFAPSSGIQSAWFKAREMDPVLLEQTGLIQEGSRNLSPSFAERIVIPIHDEFGKPVGITARCLPGSSQPKYLNTRETVLYHKSDLIFNYHRAREAARKNGRLILVEGAMDVLGLAKASIEEGIANLGVACSPKQLQLIQRVGVPVIVFYDSDRAGRQAAWKFGQAALQAGITLSFVVNAPAKDPDEIYNKYGKETLEKTVKTTVPFVQFAMEYLKDVYDLNNYEDKRAYALQVHSLVLQTLSRPEQPYWLEKLKDETGFDYTRDLPSPSKKEKRREPDRMPLVDVAPGRLKAEKNILLCMLYDYECVRTFRDKVGIFADPVHQKLALYIYAAWKAGNVKEPKDLIDMMEEDEPVALLGELLSRQTDFFDEETFQHAFNASLLTIQEDMLLRQIAAVNQEIKKTQDVEEKLRLARKKRRLIQTKNDLITEAGQDRSRKEGKQNQ